MHHPAQSYIFKPSTCNWSFHLSFGSAEFLLFNGFPEPALVFHLSLFFIYQKAGKSTNWVSTNLLGIGNVPSTK
jgi:hypothetical protein